MSGRALTATLILAVVAAACDGGVADHEGDVVIIPGGVFIMGTDEGEYRHEGPTHLVVLNPFYIQRHEVVNAQYRRFVDAGGAPAPPHWVGGDPPSGEADHPVVGVTWEDAAAYCQWAGLRLPTEAEWEYAAKGIDQRRYPWGNEWRPDCANTVEAGIGAPVAVGSYEDGVSPFGVHDMAGNAAEWVADGFAYDYYQQSPTRNPPGPESPIGHVLRGGSFAHGAHRVTTTHRNSSHSMLPDLRVGFRCSGSLHGWGPPMPEELALSALLPRHASL